MQISATTKLTRFHGIGPCQHRTYADLGQANQLPRVEHDCNNCMHAAPSPHHFWQFKGSSRPFTVEETTGRYRQGKWQLPSNLGPVVGTLLFQILMPEGFITTFTCALSGHHRSLVSFGLFMDNTDLCINPWSNDAAQKMQQSPFLWEG